MTRLAATASTTEASARTAVSGESAPRSDPAPVRPWDGVLRPGSPRAPPAAPPARPPTVASEDGVPIDTPDEPGAPDASPSLDLASAIASLGRAKTPLGEPGTFATSARLLLPEAGSRPIARPASADREQPRVQVTIGRLEVRTVPSPPPARRTASRSRGPKLTLEEYSERRMRQLREGR